MLLLAVPPPVFADELSGELPKSTRDILDEGGTDLSDAARWRFSDLCDTVGAWAAEGLQPALHLAAQSAGYLLLAGLLGLLAGDPYRAYVEILAVLGFGTLSLSAAMQLTELVATTAQDCRTYLTAFVPVFSGLAAAGGQTSGALVYSGMFFAMSGFLSAVIQKLLLPVMQLYFCFAVSACLWDNPGMGDAAALFSRCLHWLLKGCGVPDNGNDTLQYPLAGSQGRTVRRGCQYALQPQHKAEQSPAALEQPMQAAGKQRGGIPHAGVVPQTGRDRKAEIQLHDRQKQLLDDG